MFNGFNSMSLNSSSDPDVDWSVFENAGTNFNRISKKNLIYFSSLIDRYLLRDDGAWITRLSKDFWWNLERISELSSSEFHRVQQFDTNPAMARRSQPSAKASSQQSIFSTGSPSNGPPARKIVGQRSTTQRSNIPDPGNFFQNFSSFLEQDNEYNPFQSKISFDNHIWANGAGQQAIPWQ